MNIAKIALSIPLVTLGLSGMYVRLWGDCAGLEAAVLWASIGMLLPGFCLLLVGLKNYAGAEHPAADAVATVMSLMAGIICLLLFTFSYLQAEFEASMPVEKNRSHVIRSGSEEYAAAGMPGAFQLAAGEKGINPAFIGMDSKAQAMAQAGVPPEEGGTEGAPSAVWELLS